MMKIVAVLIVLVMGCLAVGAEELSKTTPTVLNGFPLVVVVTKVVLPEVPGDRFTLTDAELLEQVKSKLQREPGLHTTDKLDDTDSILRVDVRRQWHNVRCTPDAAIEVEVALYRSAKLMRNEAVTFNAKVWSATSEGCNARKSGNGPERGSRHDTIVKALDQFITAFRSANRPAPTAKPTIFEIPSRLHRSGD